MFEKLKCKETSIKENELMREMNYKTDVYQ